jgi:hypothetical protein
MLTDVKEGRQEAATFMTSFKIFTGQLTDEILSLKLTKGITTKPNKSKSVG